MPISLIIPEFVFDSLRNLGVLPTPHRYWRFVILSSNDPSFVGASEIQLRSYAGGTNEAGSGCVYSASSEYAQGSNTADKAFDGSLITGWSTDALPAFPVMLNIDFGVEHEVSIQEVSWMVSDFAPNRAPASMNVQFSDNAIEWSTAWSITGISGWVGNQAKVFTKP